MSYVGARRCSGCGPPSQWQSLVFPVAQELSHGAPMRREWQCRLPTAMADLFYAARKTERRAYGWCPPIRMIECETGYNNPKQGVEC